ncbi:MAG: protein kinase domain-containing protein [Gemmatimonadaceae bacterium]
MFDPVSATTWERIQPVLDRALEFPSPERRAFLDDACRGNPALRDEIDKMVVDCERSEPLLDRPALDRFPSLLEEDEAPALASGSTVAGRYLIEREIGRGGSAIVYLAVDVKHKRAVAVKILHPDLAVSRWAERFFRETRLTSQLQHPNILPLHDSGTVDGTLFYVRPFIEGESLRRRLEREHQLAVEDAMRIVSDVARALDYAHRVGVLHRDVKPENILLSDGQALLADFGIAKALAAAGDSITKTGFVIGTPTYIAPELASAVADIDGRADLYALGCVLFELLTGEPPYRGPTAQSVMLQHLAADVPSVRALRPSVPPSVERVVQRALAKHPIERFATGAEFARELEAASASSSSSPSVNGSVSRHVWWTAFASIGILVAGAAVLWPERTDELASLTRSYNIRRPDSARRMAATAPAFRSAPAPGDNVAGGRPSFQSSTHDPMDPAIITRAFRANDGTMCAFFSCGGVQHTDFETNAWWYVDLGETMPVSAIRIYNVRTVGPTGRLFPFTVSVHADGQSGFTSFDAPSVWSGGLDVQPNPDPLVYDFAPPPGTMGRFVKVQLNGLNWLHMAEVEVYR